VGNEIMSAEHKERIKRAILNFNEKKGMNMRNNQSQHSNRKETIRYSVSSPVEYEKNGKKETFWQSLGTAFQGEKGMTVMLNALPTNGKLFISEITDKNS